MYCIPESTHGDFSIRESSAIPLFRSVRGESVMSELTDAGSLIIGVSPTIRPVLGKAAITARSVLNSSFW